MLLIHTELFVRRMMKTVMTTVKTCANWFKRFNISDKERSGCSCNCRKV